MIRWKSAAKPVLAALGGAAVLIAGGQALAALGGG
jgi:hypothetical protein